MFLCVSPPCEQTRKTCTCVCVCVMKTREEKVSDFSSSLVHSLRSSAVTNCQLHIAELNLSHTQSHTQNWRYTKNLKVCVAIWEQINWRPHRGTIKSGSRGPEEPGELLVGWFDFATLTRQHNLIKRYVEVWKVSFPKKISFYITKLFNAFCNKRRKRKVLLVQQSRFKECLASLLNYFLSFFIISKFFCIFFCFVSFYPDWQQLPNLVVMRSNVTNQE